MAPKNTNQANFRIDSDSWGKFKEKAIENGSNATAELNKFILAYIAGNVDIGGSLDSGIGNLDIRIGDVVENAIAPLLERIEKLEAIATEPTEPTENLPNPENSPSRMAPVEQNDIAIENHPRDIEGATPGAETGEWITQSQLAERWGLADGSNISRKKKDPEAWAAFVALRNDGEWEWNGESGKGCLYRKVAC